MDTRLQWHDQAACAGSWGSYDFFNLHVRNRERLARICAGCPVKGECLEFAMDQPEGFWAGTTPDERRAMLADS